MKINADLLYLDQKVVDINYLIAQRIKTRRMILGITQHELAKRVNISVQQLQKYEKATNRIYSGRLCSFAIALDVPIEYFFTGDVNKPNNLQNFVAEDAEPYTPNIEDVKVTDQEIDILTKYFAKIKRSNVRTKIIELLHVLAQSSL